MRKIVQTVYSPPFLIKIKRRAKNHLHIPMLLGMSCEKIQKDLTSSFCAHKKM